MCALCTGPKLFIEIPPAANFKQNKKSLLRVHTSQLTLAVVSDPGKHFDLSLVQLAKPKRENSTFVDASMGIRWKVFPKEENNSFEHRLDVFETLFVKHRLLLWPNLFGKFRTATTDDDTNTNTHKWFVTSLSWAYDLLVLVHRLFVPTTKHSLNRDLRQSKLNGRMKIN